MFFQFYGLNIHSQEVLYTMPSEETEHEVTWLQWPHIQTHGWGANDFVLASMPFLYGYN